MLFMRHWNAAGALESPKSMTPFKRAVIGAEGGFPLITFLHLNKMVSVPEIDFGEELSLAWTVEEVGDLGKWVMVLLRDFVEASEINTKSKGTIFLHNE